MKKFLILPFLLITLFVKSQAPPYTRINTAYYWYGGAFDRLHLPGYNTTPTLRTGQWIGAGAVGIDTILNKFYFYSGGNWIQLASGGNPAGNYGNIQLNRNGIFSTPATDTLIYTGANGLTIKNKLGIGTTVPNAAAALEILSTTKGFLGPRMTGAQMNAIVSPVAGLLIYNTDSSAYCFYNGSVWVKVGTGGGGGGSSALSAITAATATNTIDNVDYNQTWNWNSLATTGNGIAFKLASSSGATTTNSILQLNRTGSGSGSIINKALDITNTATGGSSTNIGISLAVSGAANNYALVTASGSGNVGIGTLTPSSKAALEIASTTQGFLAPRLTTTQQNAISSPNNGLLVYNTDSSKFKYYNGMVWRNIGDYTGGAVTSFQNHSTLINQAYYDAFPSVAWDNSLTIASTVWKSSGNHAAVGNALITYSIDGFSTFTTPDTIKLNGTNLTTANTISIGRGNGTRWIAQWNYAVTNAIHFARNDENDETFSADDSLVVAGWDWVFPFGQIWKINQDTIFAPIYGIETGQTKGSVAYIKSYNNGLTWSYGTLVFRGASFDGTANPSEMDWVFIFGTKVADTKFIALARDDGYKGYHHLITSGDGGSTWTEHLISESQWAFGATNSGAIVDNSFPATLILRDGIVYALLGIRNDATNGGYSLRVFKGKALDVYASATNWNLKFTTSYRSLSFYYNGGDKDFGYYAPYFTPTGEIKAIFYDERALAVPGTGGTAQTNIKATTVLNNNFYEAYNDANQSITSGTETTVIFPDPFLDDGRYYNSDSSRIEAFSDGVYSISAYFLSDTSALGTYRQAKLKIVIRGQEIGLTAYASRVISQVTYQPTTNSKFCRFELNATAFIRKGEEIRVTFAHDKGSSLNILNSVTNIEGDGARIKIKKID